MAYPSEKKILEDLLKMYKETTCLWNPTHPGYTNKVSRKRALQSLLVKFKELDATADLYKMKKKIENMRTTYKRERQKVQRSRRAPGEGRYEPTLWYYPLLRFLDELDPARADLGADCSNDDHIDNYSSDNYAGSDSPPHKKAKPSSVYITTDEVQDYEIHSPPKVKRSLKYSSDDEEPPYLIKNECQEEAQRSEGWASPEGDPFGRAVTRRLGELLPQQRYIAEKLISDVIFLGRLNKLKTGSTINVNDDSL